VSGETDLIARHEQDGRVLSGGSDAAQLETTMERHAPPEPANTAEGPAAGSAVGDGASQQSPAAHEAKPTRGQQRFSELAKARDAEKARADAAEARAKELEARVAAPPAAREPEPKPAAAEPAKPVEKFTFPTWASHLEANPGADYDEWELARFHAFSDWKDQHSDLDTRVQRALSAEREARTVDETVARTRAKGRESYADFDAVFASGPGASVHLGPTEEQGARRCLTIFQHPQSEHLQYAIMKDGDLARRLGAMDDISFGMALSALVPVGNGHAPAAREWKTPAAPFTPVNGNSPTTATPSAALASKGHDFDASGYREKRAAERKRAGR
jgi:hypothetical protein